MIFGRFRPKWSPRGEITMVAWDLTPTWALQFQTLYALHRGMCWNPISAKKGELGSELDICKKNNISLVSSVDYIGLWLRNTTRKVQLSPHYLPTRYTFY